MNGSKRNPNKSTTLSLTPIEELLQMRVLAAEARKYAKRQLATKSTAAMVVNLSHLDQADEALTQLIAERMELAG